MFDTITPATVAASHTIGSILENSRTARIVQQYTLNTSLSNLQNIIDEIDKATFGKDTETEYQAEISRAIERVFIEKLMSLAASAPMSQARVII